MTNKEIYIGAITTILVSIITYLISSYNELKEYKQINEDKIKAEIERKATEKALKKMDSLYLVREQKEAIYKAHFDSTINYFKDYIRKDDSLINASLELIGDSIAEKQIDSIHNTLILIK